MIGNYISYYYGEKISHEHYGKNRDMATAIALSSFIFMMHQN